jgi:hypothetical protein
MSAGGGNAFWKVGNKGRGLPRKPGVEVIDERGGSPRGNRFDKCFPDREWIGFAQQGGGAVPPGTNWTRSPKEEQDQAMGDTTQPK